MRPIVLVPALLIGSAVCLSLLSLGSGQTRAAPARFAIDPDPNSPTLGDILDREAGGRAKGLKKSNASLPPQKVVADPTLPRDAVTVLAPRVKPRIIPLHNHPAPASSGEPKSR